MQITANQLCERINIGLQLYGLSDCSHEQHGLYSCVSAVRECRHDDFHAGLGGPQPLLWMRQVCLRQLADLLPEPDVCKGRRGRHAEAVPALAKHWEAGGEGQGKWAASRAEGSSQEEAGHAAACTGAEKRQEEIGLVAKHHLESGAENARLLFRPA